MAPGGPIENAVSSKEIRESADGRPLGIVEIGDEQFEALLDTGAGISIITEKVWKQMKCPQLIK